MQARHQPGGALAPLLVLAVEIAELLAGGVMLQDRRTDALHTPAFLVDQDRRMPADAVAHFGDEIGDLLRLSEILRPKRNEAPWAFRLVEGLFFGRQGKAATAQDHCF
jgi:hypothetical protein